MAKVRDNRYQNAAELVEDLIIAAGMTVNRVAPTGVTSASGSLAASDEPDEVTVVRMREEVTTNPRRAPVTVPVEPPAMPPAVTSSFNPLKVVIPAVVALVVVFAAIWALTRNTPATNINANQQTLAADPNSQPVQPSQSPTGKGEQGIPSGGTITPPANVNASPVASPEVSVDPLEDLSPVPANENANANKNTNSNKATPLPEPTRSIVPETPPPPVPSATKPAEKPSPTATPPR